MEAGVVVAVITFTAKLEEITKELLALYASCCGLYRGLDIAIY